MPVLSITWHTHPELRQTVDFCDICDNLNGVVWDFDTEETPFPDMLIHPKSGRVWDTLADESRAHGEHIYNCHCTLSYSTDTSDLDNRIETLKDKVMERALLLIGSTEHWVGVGSVRVIRSQGRFVSWSKQ